MHSARPIFHLAGKQEMDRAQEFHYNQQQRRMQKRYISMYTLEEDPLLGFMGPLFGFMGLAFL